MSTLVIPKTDEGNVVVICTELRTGIILNIDYTYHLESNADYYRVFDRLSTARDFALSCIENLITALKYCCITLTENLSKQ